jgi:predicted metal-dependent peptidase
MNNEEFQKQKTRVQRATVKIMNSPILCHLSGITQCGEVYFAVDENDPTPMGYIHTARTDGWNVAYNLRYLAQFSDAEIVAIVVHENLHKAYRHIAMWWPVLPDKQVVGMAVDYVVNGDIKAYEAKDKQLITLHKSWLYHPKYDGMNTKQIYNDLIRNGMPKDGKGQGDGTGGDEHTEPTEGSGGDTPTPQEMQQQIEAALRQGLLMQEFKNRGDKYSGDNTRLVNNLRPPQLPWQQLLEPWLTERVAGSDLTTFSRLHRRTAMQGIPTPTRYDESVRTLVIASDQSGSISEADNRRCMSDVKGMIKAAAIDEVYMVYWDTSVTSVEVYTADNIDTLIDTTRPKGGGGTDVGCVARWMSKNNVTPTACVVFTDGYVGDSWNEHWVCPVFVVLTEPNTTPFPSALLNP